MSPRQALPQSYSPKPSLLLESAELSHFTFENKTLTAQEKGPHGPDVLPGVVFTDMRLSGVYSPQEAYTLDESFFWTYNVSTGNYLTVILNHPANLNRVQVRTGAIIDGKHILEKGQVELGYQPEGIPPDCTSFTLLGRLVQGQMDQIILKSTGYQALVPDEESSASTFGLPHKPCLLGLKRESQTGPGIKPTPVTPTTTTGIINPPYTNWEQTLESQGLDSGLFPFPLTKKTIPFDTNNHRSHKPTLH
ncbi:hypothetical protein A6R68_14025 [Neotoma lepida]|uniref:Uncharacterized protein n=1 Tax=Neotoma lepida TaxID=56216 RepID=A0A1A6HCN7_NEOLE|nr:hypothetical protein A6R68_14025 [Neotoma lepida]